MICRMSLSSWVMLQVVGTALAVAMAYMIVDTYRPVSRMIAPAEVVGQVERGKGFGLRYHLRRLRECPGNVMHYAIGQGADSLSYPLTRQPIPAFRRIEDPDTFAMQPYMPAYVKPGAYAIRTVAEYHCTGLAPQVIVMDSQTVRVE